MTALKDESCIPCKGGSPMNPEDARGLLAGVPGWAMSEDGAWLRREWKFRDFAGALAFVNRAGELAEKQQHHPDFELGWGYVRLALQTHAVGGLHCNDFILAAKINGIQ